MIPKDMSPKISLLWLAAALVIIVVPRVISLDVAVWNMDEGLTAAIAAVILDGGLPYRDAVDHRGPATYYVYAAWFWLVGGSGLAKLQSLHILLMMLVAGLALGVYALGRKAGGQRIAALSVYWFAFITVNGWSGDVRAFHTEWILALGSLSGALMLLKAIPGRRIGLLFLSGLFFGLAFTSKQPAVLDFIAAGCFLCLDILLFADSSHSFSVRLKNLARCGIALVLGFLVLPILMLAYFYSQGAWADFITWFWRYNTDLYVPMVSVADRMLAIGVPWSNLIVLDQPMTFGPLAIGMLLGLYLLSKHVTGIIPLLRRLDWSGRVRLYMGVWLLLGWIAVNLSGREFGHYLIQLFVPLAVISGVAINSIVSRLAAGLEPGKINARNFVSFKPVDLFLVLIAIAVLLGTKPELTRPAGGWPQIAYPEMPAGLPMELANYLRRQTGENDRIWIWGWLSSIYVMAERQPASRFIYCSFLSGLVPWVNAKEYPPLGTEYPGAWDMWEDDMRVHPPVYIVDMAVGEQHFWHRYATRHYPRLSKFIAEEYTLEKIFYVPLPKQQGSSPFFRVYRRNGSGKAVSRAARAGHRS